MEDNTIKLKLSFKYSELVKIWEAFCEMHRELYELTAQEYENLLDSKIDELEGLIRDKETLISSIKELDSKRQSIVDEFASLAGTNINKLTDLYPLVKKFELDPNNTIERYNLLLLDIIDNIQEQNKRNQIFLNKAILSLQDLKDQFKGKKSYKTYNNKGNTLSP